MREQIEAAAAESQGIKNNAPQRQRRQWSQATKRQLVEQWQQTEKRGRSFVESMKFVTPCSLGGFGMRPSGEADLLKSI